MKSTKNTLIVGKKIIIKKVETFQDLMITTIGIKNKKQKILELLKEKENLLSDDKFGFNLKDCFCLTNTDHEFYMNLILTLKSLGIYNKELYQSAFSHFKDIMNQENFKSYRSTILNVIKTLFNQSHETIQDRKSYNKCNLLKKFIHVPVSTPLLNVEAKFLFEYENPHLEYFPMVNARVFSIG